LAGTLYIVGTPIGNLEDVTMRALRVLREVELIAAEDTRRTARLLQHYSIATPTTSLHEHNERGKGPHLIAKLQSGTSIALVSDAGMPLVSDPGSWLVTAARSAGIPIQVVPGPSAITAALAAAGLAGPFTFLGFAPPAGLARKDWLAKLGHSTSLRTTIFFEAPHRLRKTLREAAELLGNRPIVVAKELTKIHESLVERPITDWAADRDADATVKGEYVVLVPFDPDAQATRAAPPTEANLLLEFGELTNNGGLKPRAAAKALASKYQLTADEVYALHSRQAK
jgi:16S rRNA (cytidine1402-2'-O)-methyltransferase